MAAAAAAAVVVVVEEELKLRNIVFDRHYNQSINQSVNE